VMRPEEWRLIEIIRDFPQHRYFDIPQTLDKEETFRDIACASFSRMCNDYLAMREDEKKNWGAYKHSTIPHLARFPHFGVDFISTSGGRHIVNAMSKSQGPSWRMIVELSSPPKAWVNYPGGQSGDPASPHYKDMLEGFFEGEYYEVTLQNDPLAWTPARQFNITPQ
jgi:penicillin G amidase